MAFKIAATQAFAQGFNAARPNILEPIMSVEAAAPHEFQGTLVALLNKRKGQMQVRARALLGMGLCRTRACVCCCGVCACCSPCDHVCVVLP